MSGISPIRAGQTDPPAHLKFIDDQGKPVPFAAGTTFTWYVYNPKNNVTVTGQGTFNITNEAQGLVDYQWHVNDTKNLSGTYKMYAGYVLPTGGVGFGDEVDVTVKPLFVQQ